MITPHPHKRPQLNHAAFGCFSFFCKVFTRSGDILSEERHGEPRYANGRETLLASIRASIPADGYAPTSFAIRPPARRGSRRAGRGHSGDVAGRLKNVRPPRRFQTRQSWLKM